MYASVSEKVSDMHNACIPVKGTLRELLSQADVEVIFQGGEKHALTSHSFVAQSNYESALGRHSTRVGSCHFRYIMPAPYLDGERRVQEWPSAVLHSGPDGAIS